MYGSKVSVSQPSRPNSLRWEAVTSQLRNILNFVNMMNIIPFPRAPNTHVAVALVPLIPWISTAPGRFNQVQSHSFNLTKVGQTVMWLGVISAKIIPNWGQHAELKLQAILFIHIKLGKGAKCAKVIRLIDFFSGSQHVHVPHLDIVQDNNFPQHCWNINNMTAEEHNYSKQLHKHKHVSNWLSNSKRWGAMNCTVWIINCSPYPLHFLSHMHAHTQPTHTHMQYIS